MSLASNEDKRWETTLDRESESGRDSSSHIQSPPLSVPDITVGKRFRYFCVLPLLDGQSASYITYRPSRLHHGRATAEEVQGKLLYTDPGPS